MSRIEELEKRLGADPNSRIFVQLAEEYRKAGLLEQAIEVCENGLKKHPQYPSARVALGRALLEAASFDRASAEFETVLQQVPDNILANKFLGETYEKLGRLEEALQKYEIAHTLAPEDPDLEERINGVEKVLREGGPAAAAAPPPPPAPAPSPAVPPPPQASAPPARAAATPPVPPPPPAPASAAPAPPSEELEPTLFDGPAPGSPEASPPSPPEPEARSFEDDLAPIPLVEVDGPMELEERFAAPPIETPSAPPEPPAPPPQQAQPPTPPPPAPEPEQVFEAEAEFEPEQVFEAFTPDPTPPPPEPAPPVPPTPTPPAPAQAAPPPPSPQSQPKAAPPSAPAPAAPSGSSPGTGTGQVETRTMAELYASQGHLDQAIAVYRKLLEKSPDSMEYRTRLDELTMLLQATQVKTPPPPQRPGRDELSVDGSAADERDRRAIQKLEGWLDGIRKSKDAE